MKTPISKKLVVSVIGAGKMGLPLACQLASNGAQVIACDINKTVVELINDGKCPFDEPGVPELLENLVNQGQLEASCDIEKSISLSDVIIVIVPVLLNQNNEADLYAINKVTDQIAVSMKSGCLISYETTLPVGTTRKFESRFRGENRGGIKDFDLVFSPERVKSQKVLNHLSNTAKIVGGANSRAASRGAKFYAQYLRAPIINVGSLENAEFAKLAGMIYRDVNIALANELAKYALSVGVNYIETVEASNTDGEAHLLSPGIGVGGHCTPVYPYFYIRQAESLGIDHALAAKSREINDNQARYYIDLAEDKVGNISEYSVVILGLGFRPNVKEHTLSSAFLIRDALLARNCVPKLVDPLYSAAEILKLGFVPGSIDAEILIINTVHDQFRNIELNQLVNRGVKCIIDGRNLFVRGDVEKLGIQYVGVS
jgi:nucleotide sugar dehydrogenase